MNKLSKRSKVLIETINKGYNVIDNKVISPTGKIRKLSTAKFGYYYFTVRYNKLTSDVFIHHMVAYKKYGDELFNNDCVRHLDGNPKNNSRDNIVLGRLYFLFDAVNIVKNP